MNRPTRLDHERAALACEARACQHHKTALCCLQKLRGTLLTPTTTLGDAVHWYSRLKYHETAEREMRAEAARQSRLANRTTP